MSIGKDERKIQIGFSPGFIAEKEKMREMGRRAPVAYLPFVGAFRPMTNKPRVKLTDLSA